MHAIICCTVIAIQLKYYDPTNTCDSPSQLSIVYDNLAKIVSFEFLVILTSIYLVKYISPTANEQQYLFYTFSDISHSALVSLALASTSVTTYLLSQSIFSVVSFACCLICSIIRAILLKIPRARSILSSIASNFTAFTLLMPLMLLVNSPVKWAALFTAFWLFLGIA